MKESEGLVIQDNNWNTLLIHNDGLIFEVTDEQGNGAGCIIDCEQQGLIIKHLLKEEATRRVRIYEGTHWWVFECEGLDRNYKLWKHSGTIALYNNSYQAESRFDPYLLLLCYVAALAEKKRRGL